MSFAFCFTFLLKGPWGNSHPLSLCRCHHFRVGLSKKLEFHTRTSITPESDNYQTHRTPQLIPRVDDTPRDSIHRFTTIRFTGIWLKFSRSWISFSFVIIFTLYFPTIYHLQNFLCSQLPSIWKCGKELDFEFHFYSQA